MLGSTVKEDAARCLDRDIILDFGVSNDFLLCCIGENIDAYVFWGALTVATRYATAYGCMYFLKPTAAHPRLKQTTLLQSLLLLLLTAATARTATATYLNSNNNNNNSSNNNSNSNRIKGYPYLRNEPPYVGFS